MPCLELSSPTLAPDVKTRLAAALTAAFTSATGHDAGIFGVRFFEYAPGEAAVGGRVWSGEGTPYLHMLLYCPRLRRQAKQLVVKGLTEAFCLVMAKPDWQPVIHIAEHPYDNVGVEGAILTDTYPELQKRAFYYPLPQA